jgi:hypothetical protein
MVAAQPNGAAAVLLFVVALLLVVGLGMSAPSARAEAAIAVLAPGLATTVSIDDIPAPIEGRSAPAAHRANGQPLVHCFGTLCCGSICQTMAELGNPTQFPLPAIGQQPLPLLLTAPCEAPVRDAFRPPIA